MRIKKLYETYKFEESDLQGFIDLNCKIFEGFCVIEDDAIIRYYDVQPGLYQASIRFDNSSKHQVAKDTIVSHYILSKREGMELHKGYCINIPNKILDENYSELFREIEHAKTKTNIRVMSDGELCIYLKSDKIDFDDLLQEVSGLVTDTLESQNIDFELDDFGSHWVAFNIYNKKSSDFADLHFEINQHLSLNGFNVIVETIKSKLVISITGIKIK